MKDTIRVIQLVENSVFHSRITELLSQFKDSFSLEQFAVNDFISNKTSSFQHTLFFVDAAVSITFFDQIKGASGSNRIIFIYNSEEELIGFQSLAILADHFFTC
jgi:hypothetical protein